VVGWILFFFLISGFTGLAYEVCWVRLFTLAFGVEVISISAVVSAFFLGLACGAFFGGRIADRVGRPIRLYGMLELGIGVVALALPPALRIASDAVEPFLLAAPEPGVLAGILRFVPAFLLLLVPTTLMGATLPLVARAVARRNPEIAEGTGALYALNTLGATAGAFLAGFVLLPRLGTLGTTYLAAGLNLTLGVVLVLLPDRGAPPAEHAPIAPEPAERAPGRILLALLLFAFGISGFATMAYQVLWTRAFAQVFQNSIYSFATILTAYLAGIGAGSLYLSLLARRIRRPAFWFGVAQAGVAIAAIASLRILRARFDSPALPAPPPPAWHWIPIEEFLFTLGVLAVPTLLMGAAFPLVVKALTPGPERVGRRVGALYGVNTIGGVLGPLAAVYLLLPQLETRTALLAVALAHAAAAILVVLVSPRPWAVVRLGAAASIGLVVALVAAHAPRDLRTWRSPGSDDRLVDYREAPDGNLSVVQSPQGDLRLQWNRAYSLGGSQGILVERRQGHLPLLLHPDPKRVLLLGLGTGDTAGAVGVHPGVEVDCLEILPGVIEMARLFRDSNYAVLDNPQVTVRAGDGRIFVRRSHRAWDVIIGDLYLPRRQGVGYLYTLEQFEAVRAKLAPGGWFVQWLPLHQLGEQDLATIARTFLEVFPDAKLWTAYLQAFFPVAALAGSNGAAVFSLDALDRRLHDPSLLAVLDEAGFPDRNEVLCLFVCGPDRLRERFGGAPLATDDRPRIEFTAPATVRPEIDQGLDNLRLLLTLREPIAPGLGLPPETVATSGTDDIEAIGGATGHLLAGHVEILEQSARPVVLPSELAARREAIASRFLAALRAAPHFLSAVYSVNTFFHDLLETGALAAADALITPACAIRPDSAVLLYDLAELRRAQGRPDEAIEPLERAAELRPGHFDTLVRLALLYRETGRRDEALRALESARRLDMRGSVVHKLLGFLYLEAGRTAEAVEALEVARRIEPGDPEVAAALEEARRRLAQPPR